MSADALLNLDGIGFTRNRRVILDDVSLTLREGNIVTLIGPNGAGKSTLLKIALGQVLPDRGTVTRRAKTRLGYVPQKVFVASTLPLTVSRFVTLTQRASPDEILKVLTLTGVAYAAQQSVHTLSGGEWQRVLLARALMLRPDILLLDEPAQGLDVAGQNALYDLIRRIRDDTSCGILLVSHDLHLVMSSSDLVICLQHHICCSGKPENLYHDPAYRALFGEHNVAQLAAYHHHHDHVHALDDATCPPLPHPHHES
ncbi:MAG: ATP-binding cassette domain-containing protein [Burkholderiales bacterium]|jgi:zinc transport system ATP-binding protein|nr:ATP-binding cassette domain-containing protein [Burkholderiales bacterium]